MAIKNVEIRDPNSNYTDILHPITGADVVLSTDGTEDSLDTAIGVRSNLNTTDKSSIVNAINEVNDNTGSPLTTNGDILIYNNGDTRLPKGTDGQVLKLDSGLPSWQDEQGGAWETVSSVVLVSNTSQINFENLNLSTYKILKLIIKAKSNGLYQFNVRFNNLTSNYRSSLIYGDAPSTPRYSGSTSNGGSIDIPRGISSLFTSDGFTGVEIDILPYGEMRNLGLNYKCYSTSVFIGHGCLFEQSVTLSSIQLFLQSPGEFATGSAFTLLGVK